jgi:PAT family acetyl-CoA transporter-like MFS transporter 1
MYTQITSNMMYVSQMAFFARVSDPAIGGTYMTLLNTLANIGSQWPSFCALLMMDWLGKYSTGGHPETSKEPSGNGYYELVGVCTFVGVVWYIYFTPRISQLMQLSLQDWKFVRFTEFQEVKLE